MRIIREPTRVLVTVGTRVPCLNLGCNCLFELQQEDCVAIEEDGTKLVERPLNPGEVFKIRCPQCGTHAAWGVYGTTASRPGA
jgi:hypothetical protein